jgi:hypothetical protein
MSARGTVSITYFFSKFYDKYNNNNNNNNSKKKKKSKKTRTRTRKTTTTTTTTTPTPLAYVLNLFELLDHCVQWHSLRQGVRQLTGILHGEVIGRGDLLQDRGEVGADS